ncbi:MAG: polysaccharide deacetylase family protein [Alphaproteobacteria bacterium]|nr:polysaccharide deacetylase family protein [Alphaproteobacteria bacterium]
MTDAYLTIDDTPTAFSRELGDLLLQLDAPALFFCRGQRMDENPEPVVDLIVRGFTMANHLYAHKRSSQLSFEDVVTEITCTEDLIEAAYKKAGVARPGKYIRFPHMDRGTGGWVVDFDAAPVQHRDTLLKLFSDGLNVSMDRPDAALVEKKERLQNWLRAEGFTAPPFTGVTHEWYAETEMAQAIDAMFTYSTSDWMLTDRHVGKWAYKTIDDLCRKMDDDSYLSRRDSAHIILLHDDPDNLVPVTAALINHLRSMGLTFKKV